MAATEQLDAAQAQTPPTVAPSAPAGVQFSRKAVSLSAMAESIAASGGAEAGHAMSAGPSVGQVADHGFSGTAHEVPHRAEMEQSFGGADFSNVKAYSDGPALKANEGLGANAYAHGDSIAFSTPNPSKALVAHELTHVVQQGGDGPAASGASGAGIDRSGESEAEAVESAVASGRPASSALSGGTSAGVSRKAKSIARNEGGAFSMGLTFSPEGFEKSYEYKIWEQKKPFEVPIPAVPGLNFSIKPEVGVKGAVGANWKEKAITAALGVEGSVEMGLSYGKAEIAEVYGVIAATASGAFEYKKSDKDWELEGGITLSANLAVGVSVGNGILDNRFEFGKCEIGKLTGLSWKNGHFERDKVGWHWGEKVTEMFAAIKRVIEKATQVAKMTAEAAKAVYDTAKKGGKAVYHGAAEVVHWATHW